MHTVPDEKICRILTSRRARVDFESPRLLAVDDSEDSLLALTQLLTIEGFECESAVDGVDAVAKASTWLPVLIVMDISMPRLNGIEAARRLRADRRTEHIAIVAHTALAEREVQQGTLGHEFDGYCRKGMNVTSLFWLIRHLLAT